MERARVRLANRCGVGRTIRPHRCAQRFAHAAQRCGRTNRPWPQRLANRRSRTPRARQKTGAPMEYASVQFANRCGGKRSTRSHHCATFTNAAQ
eukprot:8386256-Lingulodinium_polyedra.AAC.1